MKSYDAGYPTKTGLAGRDLSQATYCGITSPGSRASTRVAAQACGCDSHHCIVLGSPLAPGSSVRFALNVETIVLSSRKAAEPNDNIEFGPGIGPSASTS